jgi:hypothetical protein
MTSPTVGPSGGNILQGDRPSTVRALVQGSSALDSMGQSRAPADPLNMEAAEDATRRAARLNASKASDKELQDLLAERQRLLDKYFAGEISKKETTRLDYVRWSLGRIEDAKHGVALDNLERRIGQFEKVAEQLTTLQQQLNNSTNRPPTRRGGR